LHIDIIADVVCPGCYLGKLAVSVAQGRDVLLNGLRQTETVRA